MKLMRAYKIDFRYILAQVVPSSPLWNLIFFYGTQCRDIKRRYEAADLTARSECANVSSYVPPNLCPLVNKARL